jgi:acetylglutamate kinase
MITYKSTHHTDRKIVIKLGGSTLDGLNEQFYKKIKMLQEEGFQIVITHGGGPAINRALDKMGIASKNIDGLRVTTDDMIGIVQKTLIGEVNPYVVAQLNTANILAIGLNGFDSGLLKGHYLNKDVYGHVGEVTEVNVKVVEQLLKLNIVPVIACVGVTEQFEPLNINGDTVACQVAKAIHAESLLLVTDVAGIRINDEYQTNVTEEEIDQWIAEGDIYGGMIPKVKGALQCLHAGVPSVQIVNESLSGTIITQKELVK